MTVSPGRYSVGLMLRDSILSRPSPHSPNIGDAFRIFAFDDSATSACIPMGMLPRRSLPAVRFLRDHRYA